MPKLGFEGLRAARLALRRYTTGVTLLELMIVVIVLGVLAAIAIPNYRRYSMRAQRTEAKSALLQLAANQEKFYLQNNTYTLDPVALGFTGGKSEFGVYDLAIATVNGVTRDFVATATPAPGGGINGVTQTADTECASFTINSQGLRTAAPDPNAKCW